MEGKLWAVDADSGKVCDGFGEKGAVDVNQWNTVNNVFPMSLLQPPTVYKDTLFVGWGGKDWAFAKTPPASCSRSTPRRARANGSSTRSRRSEDAHRQGQRVAEHDSRRRARPAADRDQPAEPDDYGGDRRTNILTPTPSSRSTPTRGRWSGAASSRITSCGLRPRLDADAA